MGQRKKKERKNVSSVKKSEKVEKKGIKLSSDLKFFFSLFLYFSVVICFSLFFVFNGDEAEENRGKVSDEKDEIKEYTVLFNGEEQTFRDPDGHRLKIIEQDGVLYLPVQEKGLFFDYDISIDGNEIVVNDYEKPKMLNFDTYTTKGDRFTSESFYLYKYTFLLNWDTWCPDCMKLLDKLSENKDTLANMNIQVIGIPYVSKDTNTVELDKEIEKIMADKGFPFTNILTTTEIENLVQTNLTNIPTIIVVDSKGRILTKQSDVEIDVSNLLDNIHDFDICPVC